jgi:hypothetical protein
MRLQHMSFAPNIEYVLTIMSGNRKVKPAQRTTAIG